MTLPSTASHHRIRATYYAHAPGVSAGGVSNIKPASNDGILKEIRGQLGALPDGAILEEHVSNPLGAAGIRQLLADKRIYSVDVIYTPMVP